jgi:hypothetical protein
MDEAQLKSYGRRLLEGGVARAVVRRNLQELRAHLADLEAAARAQGLDTAAAQEQARSSIGDADALATAMLARPELRSLLHRHPLFTMLVLPVLLLFLCCVLALLTLAAGAGLLKFFHPELTGPVPLWLLGSSLYMVAQWPNPESGQQGMVGISLAVHPAPRGTFATGYADTALRIVINLLVFAGFARVTWLREQRELSSI